MPDVTIPYQPVLKRILTVMDALATRGVPISVVTPDGPRNGSPFITVIIAETSLAGEAGMSCVAELVTWTLVTTGVEKSLGLPWPSDPTTVTKSGVEGVEVPMLAVTVPDTGCVACQNVPDTGWVACQKVPETGCVTAELSTFRPFAVRAR